MKIEDIRKGVAEILQERGDIEGAHQMEQKLRQEFLVWLAHGAALPSRWELVLMARELIRTNDIKRWFA